MKDLKQFRIRFINKVRPDTIEIRYFVTLETNESPLIFEGHQLFYKGYLNLELLKTGDVALRSIKNIFSAIPDEYILDYISFEQPHDRKLLSVPSETLFKNFITSNNFLNRVRSHNSQGKVIIDTKLREELRLG